MALKPRHKRRIFWTTISIIGALFLAIIIIPPMITLNQFKPMIERAIYEQMAVPAKLNGDIRFSLIGGATIVANDVTVPTARIGAVLLSIPFRDIFNLQNAQLNTSVIVYDADITVDKLTPASFNHQIEIYNSDITLFGRKYHIIRADFTNGAFHATVRTDDHKYDVEFIGDTIHIKNRNNNLDITAQMYSDNTIRGHLSMDTNNINEWFGFQYPEIKESVSVSANFEWDGGIGYKITNIVTPNMSGNLEISPSGHKTIQLVSENIDTDLSFIATDGNDLLRNSTINIDFYGLIKFGNENFNHVRVQTTSTSDRVQITNIIADDIAITGGYVTTDGAENVMINIPIGNISATCLFSGTPQNWKCSSFSYGDLNGTISVSNNKYDVYIESKTKKPTTDKLLHTLSRFGNGGTVRFRFADIGGTYTINGQDISATYDYAYNQPLSWAKLKMPFLPAFISDAVGNFTWSDGMMTFIPNDKDWKLSSYDNYFYISGNNAKRWLPHIDTQSINNTDYIISGFYNNDQISNLTINVSGTEFTGTVSGDTITLHTPKLALSKFLNAQYFDNFAQNEFLSNAPILIPFDLGVNIALSADTLVYQDKTYNNFIYTLKPNTQTYSIMDNDRGNLLVSITRSNTNYEIFAQLNRFVIDGDLLDKTMPLNIRDSSITGEIDLTTHGQIAHDIYYNLSGTFDITLTGGYLVGLGTDGFYASAENITSLNAEYALADALTGGISQLKQMRIIGTYDNGNIITTSPMEITLRHATAVGGLAITDNYMTSELDLTLRGTAPTPVTIQLSIMPDGGRNYSVSEIIKNLDTGFMRAFVKTHDQF